MRRFFHFFGALTCLNQNVKSASGTLTTAVLRGADEPPSCAVKHWNTHRCLVLVAIWEAYATHLPTLTYTHAACGAGVELSDNRAGPTDGSRVWRWGPTDSAAATAAAMLVTGCPRSPVEYRQPLKRQGFAPARVLRQEAGITALTVLSATWRGDLDVVATDQIARARRGTSGSRRPRARFRDPSPGVRARTARWDGRHPCVAAAAASPRPYYSDYTFVTRLNGISAHTPGRRGERAGQQNECATGTGRVCRPRCRRPTRGRAAPPVPRQRES